MDSNNRYPCQYQYQEYTNNIWIGLGPGPGPGPAPGQGRGPKNAAPALGQGRGQGPIQSIYYWYIIGIGIGSGICYLNPFKSIQIHLIRYFFFARIPLFLKSHLKPIASINACDEDLRKHKWAPRPR